jgi:hypothetical protein
MSRLLQHLEELWSGYTQVTIARQRQQQLIRQIKTCSGKHPAQPVEQLSHLAAGSMPVTV